MNMQEIQYLKAGANIPDTESSLLVSSSKYLNNAKLRDVVALEALRKNGEDIPLAYLVPDAMIAFGETMDMGHIAALFEQECATNPAFKSWLGERFISSFSVDDLKDFEPGTLGNIMYKFHTETGLENDFMFGGDPEDDHMFYQKRRIQVHDIEHKVTGFDTDPMGENALTMAMVSNAYAHLGTDLAHELTRFNMYLISMNQMKTALHYPKVMPVFLESLKRGIELGESCVPLYSVKYEDYFDWTIADIREELKMSGAPQPGEWEWTFKEWVG